jgi:uncharacterized membrane protein YeaQ/YmgE (transglycosylase-associated protein family)
MLHVLAFAVVGIVIGAAMVWGRQPGHLILGIIAGLIGSFAAGELILDPHAHRLLSIGLGVVGAAVLGFIARVIAARASAT